MAAPDETLDEYYSKYDPGILAHKYTCVGLAMEVIKCLKVLEEDFPGITNSMMLVSCDENIEDVKDYTTSSPGPQEFLIETEKDHVLVAAHVNIAGRPGVFISDLGYHISSIVTVMADLSYPHTGWFTQCDEPQCRKDYNYQFNIENSNYVEWYEKKTRNDILEERVSLVYVAKEYLSAVTVTEKRDLVWNLRSLLARDPKGLLTAGIYFPVRKKDQQFTIFFDGVNGKEKKKLNFESFLELQTIPDEIVAEVELCNNQLHLKDGELLSILNRLAKILSDDEFMTELHDINDKVIRLSAG